MYFWPVSYSGLVLSLEGAVNNDLMRPRELLKGLPCTGFMLVYPFFIGCSLQLTFWGWSLGLAGFLHI